MLESPCDSPTVCGGVPRFGHITRAHSFPQTAEFRAEPRNLGFSAEFFEPRNLPRDSSFSRGISADFDVFLSNSYIFTENDLKVALLQVFL